MVSEIKVPTNFVMNNADMTPDLLQIATQISDLRISEQDEKISNPNIRYNKRPLIQYINGIKQALLNNNTKTTCLRGILNGEIYLRHFRIYSIKPVFINIVEFVDPHLQGLRSFMHYSGLLELGFAFNQDLFINIIMNTQIYKKESNLVKYYQQTHPTVNEVFHINFMNNGVNYDHDLLLDNPYHRFQFTAVLHNYNVNL